MRLLKYIAKDKQGRYSLQIFAKDFETLLDAIEKHTEFREIRAEILDFAIFPFEESDFAILTGVEVVVDSRIGNDVVVIGYGEFPGYFSPMWRRTEILQKIAPWVNFNDDVVRFFAIDREEKGQEES